MKKIIWTVAVIILVGAGYIGGVWLTGNKTADVLEERSAEIFEMTAYNADIQWVERGIFSSRLEITLSIPEMQNLIAAEYKEEVTLKHGFLRSQWQGEADFRANDFVLSDQLLDNQRIHSEGVIGAGGVSLLYTLPAVTPTEAWGFSTEMQPLTLRVVATESESHFELNIPELTALGVRGDSNEQVPIMHTQDSLVTGSFRHDDGELVSQQVITRIGRFEMLGGYFGMLQENMWMDISTEVHGTLFDAHVDMGVSRMVLDDMSLSFDVQLELLNLDYDAVRPLRDRSEIELAEQQIYSETDAFVLGEDPVINIDKMDVTLDGWGDLSGHGQIRLNTSDIPRNKRRNMLLRDDGLNRLTADIQLEEAPMPVLLMFMGITSDELPWHLKLDNGRLYINDALVEEISLPDLAN